MRSGSGRRARTRLRPYPRWMALEWGQVIVGSTHHPARPRRRRRRNIAAIDAVDSAGDKVVLVGHSVDAAIAHAAVDALPVELMQSVLAGIERQ
jgi:hypothetical protein